MSTGGGNLLSVFLATAAVATGLLLRRRSSQPEDDEQRESEKRAASFRSNRRRSTGSILDAIALYTHAPAASSPRRVASTGDLHSGDSSSSSSSSSSSRSTSTSSISSRSGRSREKKLRVSFSPELEYRHIPHFLDYDSFIRSQVWTSTSELCSNARRHMQDMVLGVE